MKSENEIEEIESLMDLCPVCGEHVTITGNTTDDRLIGSCGDVFSKKKWEADPCP